MAKHSYQPQSGFSLLLWRPQPGRFCCDCSGYFYKGEPFVKGFLKSKLIFTLVALLLLVTVLTSGFIGHRLSAHAASRSSLNIGYVNYDDIGFTDSGIPSANIFTNAIIGGPSVTSSATAPVTYNGMTFTPLKRADISSATLANYDTLILFELCDINTSL